MSAAFVAGLGQNAVAAFRAALIGIPMAIIWDLHKK
jgi:hypothetical protein